MTSLTCVMCTATDEGGQPAQGIHHLCHVTVPEHVEAPCDDSPLNDLVVKMRFLGFAVRVREVQKQPNSTTRPKETATVKARVECVLKRNGISLGTGRLAGVQQRTRYIAQL